MRWCGHVRGCAAVSFKTLPLPTRNDTKNIPLPTPLDMKYIPLLWQVRKETYPCIWHVTKNKLKFNGSQLYLGPWLSHETPETQMQSHILPLHVLIQNLNRIGTAVVEICAHDVTKFEWNRFSGCWDSVGDIFFTNAHMHAHTHAQTHTPTVNIVLTQELSWAIYYHLR